MSFMKVINHNNGLRLKIVKIFFSFQKCYFVKTLNYFKNIFINYVNTFWWDLSMILYINSQNMCNKVGKSTRTMKILYD
jgi:hypothetical protein